MKRIIAGGKTWVDEYVVEIVQKSSELHTNYEPKHKKRKKEKKPAVTEGYHSRDQKPNNKCVEKWFKRWHACTGS